ncbi:MAG: ABC transporter permease [Desulfurococcales archaeon]|nr:ABC transporter permease [Desulfurococcales archaeon]
MEAGDLLVVGVISLSAMVPIALTALGEVLAERSGVVNIGLEGILLLTAWLGVYVVLETGSILLGYLAGLLLGALLGLMHAAIAVYLKGDQIIAGLGLNIAAAGLTALGTLAAWGNYGQSPPLEVKPPGIEVLGQRISPLVFVAILVGVGIWWLLEKTRLGHKIKAVGDDPRSADALGINVERIRLAATVAGASLAGLAGAYMSIDYLGSFVKLMSGGRGFIALADVAFSGWNPLGALLGAAIFGFSDAVARYYNIVAGTTASSYLINTIPYIVTLVAVAATARRARMPRALGRPYIKE